MNTNLSLVTEASLSQFDQLPDTAFVRLATITLILGCSPSSVWRWVHSGLLPKPYKIGVGVTSWNVGELRGSIKKMQSACKVA